MIYKLLADNQKPFATNSPKEALRAFDRVYNSGIPCVLYVDGIAVMRGNKFDAMGEQDEN